MFIKKLIVKVVIPVSFLIVAVVGLAYIMTESTRTKRVEINVQEINVDMGAAALARGEDVYLTRGCADCHDLDAGGKTFINEPPIGHYAGTNLTTGSGGVATKYKTAKDWNQAIRYGLDPSGRPLMFMPSHEFHPLSVKDTAALIAYLMSRPAVNRTNPASMPGPMARVLYLFGQFPMLFPYQHVDATQAQAEDVPMAATVEYGQYLATGCVGCHGQNYTGGRIPGVPPDWPPAADITSKGVMGQYGLADFKLLMRTGKTFSGKTVDPKYMPWTGMSRLKDVEIEALFNFLRSR